MCELIRKHKTKEFIIYMNRKGLSFDSFIDKSIFETNPFLLKIGDIKIIENASFFGSMEIINFLISEKVNLLPSMWKYSIHSENSELIHYLEDNQILPTDNKHKITLNESIKCHHNDISRYIINYLIKEEDLESDKENDVFHNLYKYSFQYDNYIFFPDNIKYKFMFHYLCEFDYYILVNLYLTNEDIDINTTIISISTN